MKNFVLPIIFLSLTGCATSQPAIDSRKLTYENVKFKSKESRSSTSDQFIKDIAYCHYEAQKQHETNIKNTDDLAKIYGQTISPEAFLILRKLHVIDCMAGDASAGTTGKGWSVVKGS